MRDEELKRARVSKYKKQSSFQNLFHERLQQMPGKRERAQFTIHAVIEHTIGNRTEYTDKTYGPFKMEVPKLSEPDMYKFLMYTLLQNKFTVLSTETIAEVGADISTHNTQFFKDHKAGALKLNTFFLDKQFQIKQRGDNTCTVDFVWHNCKGKKGFQKYTNQKLSDELEVYAPRFPMMSTQELVTWAKECHPNVSIHAYDSTWRKFMKHNPLHQHTIALVFYIKDHHLYPIQDNHLKQIATEANQGGADNLWRYMSELKWSNRSNNYIKYQQLVDNADADIVKQKDNKTNKPTLLTIENHVIILPEDMKIEYVIEEYMIRSNYFVEYLHYDNKGRLDGFMDNKHNMYILNNDYDIRKEICRKLFRMYKTHDFIWCNQSYTALASSMFKHMREYLPESQYDTKTREVLDDSYPRALQWCASEELPEFVTSLDICKCYPSILINNTESIPFYTIHDVILSYDNNELVPGEYYIDEYQIPMGDSDVGIEAGFYSRRTIKILIEKFNTPKTQIKWYIPSRKALRCDTFKNYLLAIFSLFPESEAKLLANSFIGNLGKRYSRKDSGFVCQSMDTVPCIWTSALAENRNITIDSYRNLTTKNELYLVRESKVERILSDNASINRFVISEAIANCLEMIYDNWEEDSKLYAVNTDGIFISNPKNSYPNKKDVEFKPENIGNVYQTDSKLVYFEKH